MAGNHILFWFLKWAYKKQRKIALQITYQESISKKQTPS